jgi:hypothetical protein
MKPNNKKLLDENSTSSKPVVLPSLDDLIYGSSVKGVIRYRGTIFHFKEESLDDLLAEGLRKERRQQAPVSTPKNTK